MKRILFIIFICLLICFYLGGCLILNSIHPNPVNSPTPFIMPTRTPTPTPTFTPQCNVPSNVYIVGEYSNAYYWNDYKIFHLPDSSYFDSVGLSIFLKNTDVYVCGYQVCSDGNFKPCYWKNDTQYILPDIFGGAHSIVVTDSSDIYIAGDYRNGDFTIACYWKNGIKYDLYTSDKSHAYNCCTNGSDIYIAGSYGWQNACYWKNGIQHDLQTGIVSVAYAIFTTGDNVYVAGTFSTYTDGKYHFQACYWKNSNVNVLPDIDMDNAFANSIFIDGADVYVLGSIYNSPPEGIITEQEFCYWKNGVKTIIPDADEATSIFVKDQIVYITGSAHNTACYWVNGELIELPGRSAKSIFVK